MKIESYKFGEIIIDGKTYTNDLILIGDTVYPDWWRKEGHKLRSEDLGKVMDTKPSTLIVGTGYYGRMKVLDSTKSKLEEIGCELVAMKSTEATEIFNKRSSERDVALAIHLTC